MAKSPLYNFSFIFLGRIIDLAVTLVFYAFAARFLGAETFGTYFYSINVAILFITITDAGLSRYAIHHIARGLSEGIKDFSGLWVQKALNNAVCLLLFSVFIWGFPNESTNPWTLFYLLLSFILFSLADYILDVFRAREEMSVAVCLNLGYKLILTLSGSLGLLAGYRLKWLVLCHAISAFLFLLGASLYLWKQGLFHALPCPTRKSQTNLIKAFPFGIINLLGAVNFRVIIYLLGFFCAREYLGFFGAPHRLVEALCFFPFAVGAVAFPNFIKLFHQKSGMLHYGLLGMMKVLFFLALPICVGATVLAPAIIFLFYGEAYDSSILPLRILIWSILFIFVNYVGATFLQAIFEKKRVARILSLGICIQILSGFILIPVWNIQGGAIAILLGECVMGIAYLSNLRPYLLGWEFIKAVGKAFLATAFMTGVLFIPGLSFPVQVVLSMIIYGFVLWLMKPFAEKEMNWLRFAIQSKTESVSRS